MGAGRGSGSICRQGAMNSSKPSSPAAGRLCGGGSPLTDEVPKVEAGEDLRNTRSGSVRSDLVPWYPPCRDPPWEAATSAGKAKVLPLT